MDDEGVREHVQDVLNLLRKERDRRVENGEGWFVMSDCKKLNVLQKFMKWLKKY